MGDTRRLTNAVSQVTEKEGISTIFLLPSSVPEVIGTDLCAIAQELSVQFPETHFIPLSVGSFDFCGHKGVELTLLQLAETLSKEMAQTIQPSFNIIGSCADLFAFRSDAAEIKRLVKGAFFARLLCTMTSGTRVEELSKISAAHFNLVVRREGEAAAKYLNKRYGIPYLIGRPYGVEGTRRWLHRMEDLFHLQRNSDFIRQERQMAEEQLDPMMLALNRF